MTTVPGTHPPAVTLCRIDEIDDPGARGFEVSGSNEHLDIIVVRQGDSVHGYINSCPHQGTPLETFPDRFLSRDGRELICSTHGARFQPADGLCTGGPCKGKRLAPIQLGLEDGCIRLHLQRNHR